MASLHPTLASRALECAADAGVNASGRELALKWAHDGDAGSPWTANPNQQIDWSSQSVHTLYGALAELVLLLVAEQSDVAARRGQVGRLHTRQLGRQRQHRLMRFSDNGGPANVDQAAEGGMV